MAKKKTSKKKPKSEIADVLEIVGFLRDNMMTRSETEELFTTIEERIAKFEEKMSAGFLSVEERLYAIEQELKEVKRRLISLEGEMDHMNARNKSEVEELWKHVVAIEKQLKARTHK